MLRRKNVLREARVENFDIDFFYIRPSFYLQVLVLVTKILGLPFYVIELLIKASYSLRLWIAWDNAVCYLQDLLRCTRCFEREPRIEPEHMTSFFV